MLPLKTFLTSKLAKSTDTSGAISTLNNMLKDYDVLHPVAVLPDFTESSTLPVGTTTIIKSNKALNPSFVGMDIGCGYQMFTMEINPKRFYKNGKFKYDSTLAFVQELSAAIMRPRTGVDRYLGTIGKGNHFINMYVVQHVFNQDALDSLGIKPKSVSFLIHTGSRVKGFDTHQAFAQLFAKNDLSADAFNENYLAAFAEAKDYALQNRNELRRMITEHLEDYRTTFILDKAHNDIESCDEDAFKIRKGTASLKPGEVFLIPSTATGNAYLVKGKEGLAESYYTINHGCGRKYTRTQMFSRLRKTNFESMFSTIAMNVTYKQMIEEVPTAYKNIDEVITSVEEYDLAEKVAALRPLGLIVER
jgi:release factor H-coupled RctB family protein